MVGFLPLDLCTGCVLPCLSVQLSLSFLRGLLFTAPWSPCISPGGLSPPTDS